MAKEGIGKEFTGVAMVFICHDGEGNILIAKRSKGARDEHERWELPAGGLKFNERAEDGVRREIREELCTDAKTIEFLGYRDLLRILDDVPTHWVMLDFLVRVDRDKVKIGEPQKCDELRWVRFGEWLQPLHSAFMPTIEKNKERLLVL